jgi:hypothetical protein
MIIPNHDKNDYQNSLQELYDLLQKTYWIASTIEAKDAINGLAQAASEILTTLNQGELDTATSQYTALKSTIVRVNAKLQTVHAQVDGWIHAISVAAEVTEAIDKTVNLATKVVK